MADDLHEPRQGAGKRRRTEFVPPFTFVAVASISIPDADSSSRAAGSSIGASNSAAPSPLLSACQTHLTRCFRPIPGLLADFQRALKAVEALEQLRLEGKTPKSLPKRAEDSLPVIAGYDWKSELAKINGAADKEVVKIYIKARTAHAEQLTSKLLATRTAVLTDLREILSGAAKTLTIISKTAEQKSASPFSATLAAMNLRGDGESKGVHDPTFALTAKQLDSVVSQCADVWDAQVQHVTVTLQLRQHEKAARAAKLAQRRDAAAKPLADGDHKRDQPSIADQIASAVEAKLPQAFSSFLRAQHGPGAGAASAGQTTSRKSGRSGRSRRQSRSDGRGTHRAQHGGQRSGDRGRDRSRSRSRSRSQSHTRSHSRGRPSNKRQGRGRGKHSRKGGGQGNRGSQRGRHGNRSRGGQSMQ